ncbi:hypothetical protein QQ008_10215 [Fulvivirgaceae bacterium BMA10]|uniref:TPM domain-containing protein n=1 Tax=Splendidivirga corallicola TaxID=3051826 RepID=A0ABT8KLZ3_9BACT|nr:hypothetical protein [Fulvivirgaceae bacterium BMA10]
MKLNYIFALFLSLLITGFPIHTVLSQNGGNGFLASLNYTNKLPEKIRASRTVALVHSNQENEKRDNWKTLAKEAHKVLTGTGVDIIGYYNLQDVMAGPEAQINFSNDFLKREAKNIIIIQDRGGNFVIRITAFSGTSDYINEGQEAWKTESTHLDEALSATRRAIGASGQRNQNFLVADLPEFFEDTNIIKKGRFETFNRDLKLDKLAVVLLPLAKELPENDPRRLQWKSDSLRFAQIMASYPFEYEFVSFGEDEQELRKKGFQFMLYYLHSTGKVIRNMLDYPDDKNVTDYVTITQVDGRSNLKTFSKNQLVYKFYVKHIFSKEVYLGNEWDADETWDAALTNHIQGLTSKVKK